MKTNRTGMLLPENNLMKKILFIASHRFDRAPGQRFRFEQYFQFLKSKGYSKLTNVKGGIGAWSKDIDPTIPSY